MESFGTFQKLTCRDESIAIKELIFPAKSRLNSNKAFVKYSQQWDLSLPKFANAFWTEASKMKDEKFNAFLNSLDKDVSTVQTQVSSTQVKSSELGGGGGNDPSIYFPYNEEFIPSDGEYYAPITTVTTATADADEGWGLQPYYLNGVFQYYIQVLVNDDYCFDNPTHIVGVNGIEIQYETSDAPPPPPPPPGISRVYVGETACKTQYDRLISFTGNGGGSEVKYCRLSGYLQPVNGQVTSFQDIASYDFTRKAIRTNRLVRFYATWDDDWVPDDLEQVFTIYEEDNDHTITFEGSVTTTLSTGNTGTLGYKIERRSNDVIIRQMKISRHSYFQGSFQDQGWGFSSDATFLPLPFTHGWPFYDGTANAGAPVIWTWPYNTY